MENEKTYTKSEIIWLVTKTEQCSERYMEAEQFILEMAGLSWFQRIFAFSKLKSFLSSRSKYKF